MVGISKSVAKLLLPVMLHGLMLRVRMGGAIPSVPLVPLWFAFLFILVDLTKVVETMFRNC
jgi:hypothetical protein